MVQRIELLDANFLASLNGYIQVGGSSVSVSVLGKSVIKPRENTKGIS